MSDSGMRASDECVEITGDDVWEAIKTGLKLSFLTGLLAAVVLTSTVPNLAEGGPAR